MAGIVSVVLLFIFPWAGALGVILTVAIPSRTRLAKRELRRRLTQFQSAVSELRTRPCVADVDRVLALPQQLNIPDVHVGHVIDQLRSVRELTLLEHRGAPEPVEGVPDVLGREPCYFAETVFLDKHGKDETGTVYFGNERLVFVGETRIETPWEKVMSWKRENRILVVQRADRQTPYNFIFDDLATATRAEWVASKMMATRTL